MEFDVFKSGDLKQQTAQTERNGVILHDFAQANRRLLGLSRNPSLKIWARKFHEVHRVGPDGKLIFYVVAELIQHRDVPLDPSDPHSPKFTFYGGATLILSQDGEIRYIIHKDMGEEKDDSRNERLKRQRDYLMNREARLSFAPYRARNGAFEGPMNFSSIHRGY